MSEQERKVGRPRKYSERERRPTLTFRARDNLYAQLQTAATESDRSLSEEIERRLAASFAPRDPLDPLVQIVVNLIRTAQAVTGKSWRADKPTRVIALDLVFRQLEGMVDDPEGTLLAKAAHQAMVERNAAAWREPDTSRAATLQPAGRAEWSEAADVAAPPNSKKRTKAA